MAGMKFSLRTAFAGMAVASVCAAGLVQGDDIWSDSIFSVALLAFLIAVTAALFKPPAERTFYQGFCLFAGAYLAIVFLPSFDGLKHDLVTHSALQRLQRVLAPIHARK